jgi:hypothetical protein
MTLTKRITNMAAGHEKDPYVEMLHRVIDE